MIQADYPFDIIEAAVSAGHAAYEKVAQATTGAPHIRRKLAIEEATKSANAALSRFASIRALRGSISDKATGPTERVATVGDAVAEPSRATFSSSLDPFGAAQTRLGASANPSKVGRLSENHLDMLERAAERCDVPTFTEALALIAEVRAARASAGEVARLTAENDVLDARIGCLRSSLYIASLRYPDDVDIRGGLSGDDKAATPIAALKDESAMWETQDSALREQSAQAAREASAIATGTDATSEARPANQVWVSDLKAEIARLTAEVERLKNDLARHDQLYSDRQAELEGQRDTAEAEVERLKCAHSDIATTFHDREVRLTASYEKRVKELLSALDEALDPDVKAIVAERDALAKRVQALRVTLETARSINPFAVGRLAADAIAADDKAGAS